jgi:hypothetical protein
MDSKKIIAIAAAAGVSALALKKYLEYKKAKEVEHTVKKKVFASKEEEKSHIKVMPLKKVRSSMIQGIGEVNKDLVVQFNDGHRYKFYNVPTQVKKELLTAGSHGKYFAQYIKDRYKHEKVAELQHALSERLY